VFGDAPLDLTVGRYQPVYLPEQLLAGALTILEHGKQLCPFGQQDVAKTLGIRLET
jgi:hypothetical protein